MERQEKGGVKTAGSKNLIIPTTKARGGSNAGKVRQKYYWSSINQNMVKGSFSKNFKKKSKARTVARAAVAAKTKKFIRMNDAIFSVSNFRAAKGRVHFRLNEVLNLKHKSTVTPKQEWLQPAASAAAAQMQAIYNSEMAKL